MLASPMGVGGPQGGGSSVAAPVEVAQRLAERALACWWRTAASAAGGGRTEEGEMPEIERNRRRAAADAGGGAGVGCGA